MACVIFSFHHRLKTTKKNNNIRLCNPLNGLREWSFNNIRKLRIIDFPATNKSLIMKENIQRRKKDIMYVQNKKGRHYYDRDNINQKKRNTQTHVFIHRCRAVLGWEATDVILLKKWVY